MHACCVFTLVTVVSILTIEELKVSFYEEIRHSHNVLWTINVVGGSVVSQDALSDIALVLHNKVRQKVMWVTASIH